jgi:hypothetical protein
VKIVGLKPLVFFFFTPWLKPGAKIQETILFRLIKNQRQNSMSFFFPLLDDARARFKRFFFLALLKTKDKIL